jgi:hypothetical protein
MTEDTRRFKSTSEMALSRIGGTVPSALPGDHLGAQGQVIRGVVSGDQAAQIQRNIDRTMLGLVADIRRGGDPVWGGQRPATVRPADAAPVHTGGTGWRKEVPIETPGGATAQTYIDALAHSFQPHGVSNPERKGKK